MEVVASLRLTHRKLSHSLPKTTTLEVMSPKEAEESFSLGIIIQVVIVLIIHAMAIVLSMEITMHLVLLI